jgi:diguanylate cyclase (GGDEF)-like protein
LRWPLLHAAALGLLAVIGILDAFTGGELSLSIFYLVPVGLVAWHGSRRGGIVLAFLAGAVWLIADLPCRTYTHPVISGWNASVRLGFFVLVALGLARIRTLLRLERKQARQDTLTGIPNSRQFFEVLGREVARSRRHRRPLTVAYLDLDGFKQVNDKHGHPTGDHVLQQAARVLKESIRLNDVVARLGGDEFALLLPETEPGESRTALERVRQRLALAMEDSGWPVSASIGAVTFMNMPLDAHELVQLADQMMYRAKKQGKNQLYMQVYQTLDE